MKQSLTQTLLVSSCFKKHLFFFYTTLYYVLHQNFYTSWEFFTLAVLVPLVPFFISVYYYQFQFPFQSSNQFSITQIEFQITSCATLPPPASCSSTCQRCTAPPSLQIFDSQATVLLTTSQASPLLQWRVSLLRLEDYAQNETGPRSRPMFGLVLTRRAGFVPQFQKIQNIC